MKIKHTNRLRTFKLVYHKKENSIFYSNIVVSKILIQGLTLLSPFLYYLFVNYAIGSLSYINLIIAILGYCVLYLIETFLMKIVNNKIINYCATNQYIIRKKLTTNFSSWELDYYSKYTPFEAKKTIVDDTEILKTIYEKHLIDYYIAILIQCIIIFILPFLSPELTCLSVLSYILTIYFINHLSKKAKKVNIELRNKSVSLEKFEKNVFDNWKDIKTNGIEDTIIIKFNELQYDYSNTLKKQRNCETISRLIKAFKDFSWSKLYYICLVEY